MLGGVACSDPPEVHTDVFLRAFDTGAEPLERARVVFRDAEGEPVGAGQLRHGNGFRFESEQVDEDADWGRRVRTADLEAGSCASRGDRIGLEQDSVRVAVGGHPSLRSKKIIRYTLRASLICFPPLGEDQRRAYERGLREGPVRSRIRAAILLGWLGAPEDADDELEQALQDGSAIGLGLVHHPDPSALPALTAALDDERERVRFAAALLLARLGRNEHGVASAALPALERRRNDPSELVQLVASYARGRIAPR